MRASTRGNSSLGSAGEVMPVLSSFRTFQMDKLKLTSLSYSRSVMPGPD